MISVFIFGIFLGLIHFFRLRTVANIYDCVSVAGDPATDHVNNEFLDNVYAVGSVICIGLVLLALYDSSFAFSVQYFSSKMSFIVEEPATRSNSIWENMNAASLLAGICFGELGRSVFDRYHIPVREFYYGQFEDARPASPRDITIKAGVEICTLLLDIDTRTMKMVEVALGTEFQLNVDERQFVADQLRIHRKTIGSHRAILKPINQLYGKDSAGSRAFFEHIARVCKASGFRSQRTADRLQLAAGSLGISRIEAMTILLKMGFTLHASQSSQSSQSSWGQTQGGTAGSNRQYSRTYAEPERARAPSSRADYLAILGLAPGANDKKIKSAYRKFAKKYHPDILQSQNLTPAEMEAASAKMAEINMAYDWLMES